MELDIAKKLPIQIERLLKMFLPSDSIARYKPFFYRLISMTAAFPTLSEQSILKKMKKRTDPKRSKRIDELYSKLIQCKQLKPRTSMLYLLLKLEETSTVSLVAIEPQKPVSKISKANFEYSEAQAWKPSISKQEKELLNDILYVLQGGEGKYLKFSHFEDKYAIQPAYLPPPKDCLLQELTELGCLYRKLVKMLNYNHIPLTNIAFCQAIQDELEEYYRLLAVLNQEPELSMKKLHLWLFEPLERMKWLAILSEACETLRGPEIISAVNSYIKNGNFSIKQILLRIFEKVLRPLMSIIFHWISEGDINDPHSEFFIGKNDIIDESQIWSSTFYIIPDNVPNIFPKKVVEKVLIAGKTINFLRDCCKRESEVGKTVVRQTVYEKVSFEGWIFSVSKSLSKELLQVLFNEFHFPVHCNYIKKSLLLGQGDFHHSLMEQLIEVLDEHPGSVHKHTLRVVLENSIKNSNFQDHEQEFLNNIDIKVLDSKFALIGWDIITLDYIVPFPMNSILTQESLEVYRQMFRLLWMVKRAQFTLNEIRHIKAVLKSDETIQKVAHNLMFFRNVLRHFVNNLMSYLMVEVVESSWAWLYAEIFKANDLDELIQTHTKYLYMLKSRAFVSNREVHRQLMSLLTICINSQKLQQRMIDCIDFQTGINNLADFKVMQGLSKDVFLMHAQFDSQIKAFRQKICDLNDADIKSLAFRLDFNEFYEIQGATDKRLLLINPSS
jgi:gamma-tubulin complex component 3